MTMLKCLLGISAFILAVQGGGHTSPMYGTHVGDLSELAHLVQGEVYVVDASTIRIKHFHYDGQGPDAFFYIGTASMSPSVVSGDGMRIMDENGRSDRLYGYHNADVVLTLPNGITVDQIKWLSVWCFQATVDFGSLMFPASITLPVTVNLGALSQLGHGVSSGQVTILNHRQIHITAFNYDGTAPDTYFWVGMYPVDENGDQIPNEMGSMENLMAYTNQDIVLTLPRSHTVFDIGYLSVWCEEASVDFGNVAINVSVNDNIVPYVADLQEYRGKLIGDLTTNAHEVSGTVYLVDNNRIRITNFHYDGMGPDAYFWMGSTAAVDTSGMIVPNELGLSSVLGMYEDEDIVLNLPPGSLLTAKWFSVWCRNFTVNFGHIYFPSNINPPAPADLGRFSELAHQVSSGPVTLLNTRQLMIETLTYDGQGPDAYFYVGIGTPDENGTKIPNEMGSDAILQRYQGETITLTLPEGMSFLDYGYVSIWCVLAVQDFGNVMIPTGLLVPPYVDMMPAMEPLENCEQMHERLNVAWEIDEDYIHYELTGALDMPDNVYGYMAFGLSGSDTRSLMAGADVAVAYYSSQQGAVVVDYSLTAYSQCAGGVGACPDTMLNGMHSLEDVEGYQVNGVTTVRFKRALNTSDSADRVVSTSGSQYVVWAMGRLSEDTLVTKHNLRLQGNKQLEFGRAASVNCPEVMSIVPPVEVNPWMNRMINGRNVMEFTARIGPAGPEQYGYAAITGQQSWGIAWYINGELIPEITLTRGMEYTFRIEGGDDTGNLAMYHPFYITDDRFGGYFRKTDQEKANVRIFAGIDMATGNPTGVGKYCEYTTTSSSSDYEEFKDSLTLNCDDGETGMFKWTPDENTPDTVYYQCYTHRYLGWKINVIDDTTNPNPNPNAAVTTKIEVTTIFTTLLALISLKYFF